MVSWSHVLGQNNTVADACDRGSSPHYGGQEAGRREWAEKQIYSYRALPQGYPSSNEFQPPWSIMPPVGSHTFDTGVHQGFPVQITMSKPSYGKKPSAISYSSLIFQKDSGHISAPGAFVQATGQEYQNSPTKKCYQPVNCSLSLSASDLCPSARNLTASGLFCSPVACHYLLCCSLNLDFNMVTCSLLSFTNVACTFQKTSVVL